MKISSDEAVRASSSIDPIAPAKLPFQQTAPAATPGAGPAAKIEISDQAKALTAAKAEAAGYLPAVHAAPETRDGLVASLKTKVESGSYHVASTDIADQILRRAQADNIK